MGLEETYTDSTLLQKGRYKGTRLYLVSPEYLLRIYTAGIKASNDKALFIYIEKNLGKIKTRKETGTIEVPVELEQQKQKKWEEVENWGCEKKSWPTKKAANEALRRIRNSPGDHQKPIRSYECDKCNQWHLTHLPYDLWKEKERAQKLLAKAGHV